MSLGEISNEHLKTINFSWDFAVDPEHSLASVSEEKIARFVNGLNEFREGRIVFTGAPKTAGILRYKHVGFGSSNGERIDNA